MRPAGPVGVVTTVHSGPTRHCPKPVPRHRLIHAKVVRLGGEDGETISAIL